MEVEVILVVVAPNLRVRGDMRFMLVDYLLPKLPNFTLTDGILSHQAVSELLDRYTGLEAVTSTGGWIPIKQVGVFDDVKNNRITIGFGCFIPEMTPLRGDAWWASASDLQEQKPECLEILSYIASRL